MALAVDQLGEAGEMVQPVFKNTNGARRHVFRALHLPMPACSHFACSPVPHHMPIHEDQQNM
jgi:hypothetical protein